MAASSLITVSCHESPDRYLQFAFSRAAASEMNRYLQTLPTLHGLGRAPAAAAGSSEGMRWRPGGEGSRHRGQEAEDPVCRP